MNKPYKNSLIFGVLLLLVTFCGCQKIDYEKIEDAAYLRVFNSLWDRQSLEQGGQKAYLCMLINPKFDTDGTPLGAAIVGDFLDKREDYAPPYPTGLGSNISANNTEWPGHSPVPVAPVVNGFDLSSWGQVPSGKLRVMFLYRPHNETPFFSLGKEYRKEILADTTITLEAGGVYTLQTLLLDFATKRKGVLLRKENFLEQSFSDDRNYVNFYNYSAKGFADAPDNDKKFRDTHYKTMFEMGLKDQMNVFYSLYTGKPYKQRNGVPDQLIFKEMKNPEGYKIPVLPDADSDNDRRYLTSLKRDTEHNASAPYVSLPIWSAADTTGKISTDQWQRIYFVAPGLDIKDLPGNYSEAGGYGDNGGLYNDPRGNYAVINFVAYRKFILLSFGNSAFGAISCGANMPNMIVNIPSGSYKNRSFATVNTVEVINGKVYLTTLQRRYDPPKLR